MGKQNEFVISGTVEEIGEPRFLQNGAETQTIVIRWVDTWEGGSREKTAAVGFYAAKGLEKLHALKLAVGDKVSVPVQPSSRVKEGEGARGAYRIWVTDLQGDAWKVRVEGKSAPAGDIPF